MKRLSFSQFKFLVTGQKGKRKINAFYLRSWIRTCKNGWKTMGYRWYSSNSSRRFITKFNTKTAFKIAFRFFFSNAGSKTSTNKKRFRISTSTSCSTTDSNVQWTRITESRWFWFVFTDETRISNAVDFDSTAFVTDTSRFDAKISDSISSTFFNIINGNCFSSTNNFSRSNDENNSLYCNIDATKRWREETSHSDVNSSWEENLFDDDRFLFFVQVAVWHIDKSSFSSSQTTLR